jgi:hypothetical protein
MSGVISCLAPGRGIAKIVLAINHFLYSGKAASLSSPTRSCHPHTGPGCVNRLDVPGCVSQSKGICISVRMEFLALTWEQPAPG